MQEINSLIGNKDWRFIQSIGGRLTSTTSTDVRQGAMTFSDFLKHHIPAGDLPVISLLKNSSAWNMIEWGCIQNGITHIPLNMGIAREDLLHILNEIKQGLIISDSNRYRTLVDSYPVENNFAFIHSSEIVNKSNPTVNLNPLSTSPVENSSIILYTSGSVGMAKGVVHSYEGLNHAVEVFAPLIKELKVSRALSYLPLSFSGERKLNYTYQRLGMDICYPAPSKNLLDNILMFEPEIMGMVPSMLEKLLTQLNDFSGKCPLRYIICGGASLRKDLISQLARYDIKVLGVYGLSETASIGSANSLLNDQPGSAGKLLPGVEIRFGQENDIYIHTDSLFKGYLNETIKWHIFDEKRFFRTGDIGLLDSNGYLFIEARVDNKFKLSNGTWLYPEMIERDLARMANGLIRSATVTYSSEKLMVIFDTNADESNIRKIIDEYNRNGTFELDDFVRTDLSELKSNGKSVKISRKDIIRFALNK